MPNPDTEPAKSKKEMTNIERISNSITSFDTIQHLYEQNHLEDKNTKTYHASSELLGYAMRIAVKNNDRQLFDQLYKGYQYHLSKGENGLPAAKLSSTTGEAINDEGNSWADGTQDIALALIDAGTVWGQHFKEEGIQLARKFLASEHVSHSGNYFYVMEAPMNQKVLLGERIAFVNLSMYNFHLYEQMALLDSDNAEQWNMLCATGIYLIREAIKQNQFIPNKVAVIDGHVKKYSEFQSELAANNEDTYLGSAVSAKTITKYIQINQPHMFGWDAVRIYYRIADSTKAYSLLTDEVELMLTRWHHLPVKGIPIDAETGAATSAELVSPATASVAALDRKVSGTNSLSINELSAVVQRERQAERTSAFITPTYWILWQELANNSPKV